MPGWKQDISKVRDWASLPTLCKDYVEKVEQLLGAPGKISILRGGMGQEILLLTFDHNEIELVTYYFPFLFFLFSGMDRSWSRPRGNDSSSYH